MTDSHYTTTRRAVIGTFGLLATAGTASAAAGIAGLAADDAPDTSEGDRYQLGFDGGREIATLHMARAWIDRWRAAGGDFGMTWNADGSFRGYTRGMIEPSFWTPTDQGNPKLEPHQWLVQREHQRGAVRLLDSLLTLVPGLEEAIFDIVGLQLWTSRSAPIEQEA